MVGAGAMSFTVRRRSGRQEVDQPRHRLVEHHVGDGGGEDGAHAHVGVRAHHRLERLVGDGGQEMNRSYAEVQPVLSISMAPMAADR